MIVVFDTNIWKANLYLRSEASAAVKLFLNIKSAKVALPEVVKLEVEHHLRKDLKHSRDSIVNEYGVLLAIFGRLPEVKLPSDKKIEERIASYFNESGFNIEEIPFSYEAARSSFLRTIDKTRPSHNKQQFKDGVLWEDCKALANSDDVILVTMDRAFF